MTDWDSRYLRLAKEISTWSKDPSTKLGAGGNTNGFYGGGVFDPGKVHAPTKAPTGGAFCHLCGAWRGSLGLEPTPQLYVRHLVEVFREVRRVLRSNGVLFLNLGDSYAAARGNGASSVGEKQATNAGSLLGALHVPQYTALAVKRLEGVALPLREVANASAS